MPIRPSRPGRLSFSRSWVSKGVVDQKLCFIFYCVSAKWRANLPTLAPARQKVGEYLRKRNACCLIGDGEQLAILASCIAMIPPSTIFGHQHSQSDFIAW